MKFGYYRVSLALAIIVETALKSKSLYIPNLNFYYVVLLYIDQAFVLCSIK